MGVKEAVGRLFEKGFDLWPDPVEIADLALTGEHAERALRHAREEVPRCEDIEMAHARMSWFGTRLHALEKRRQKAASKTEEAAVRSVILTLSFCWQGWTDQHEYLLRAALERGHGSNFAHASVVRAQRQRGLYPTSGDEAA